jgi:hypothetical protein
VRRTISGHNFVSFFPVCLSFVFWHSRIQVLMLGLSEVLLIVFNHPSIHQFSHPHQFKNLHSFSHPTCPCTLALTSSRLQTHIRIAVSYLHTRPHHFHLAHLRCLWMPPCCQQLSMSIIYCEYHYLWSLSLMLLTQPILNI